MPLILIGIPLIAIMAGLTAYGFSQLQHGQSHGFLNWLEGAAESSLFVIAPLAEQAIKLTSWLTHYLGKYFEATFSRLVQFIAGLNQYVRLTAGIALSWPYELLRVTQWFVTHEIPKLLKALPNATTRIVHDTAKALPPLVKIIYRVPKISRAAARAAIAAVLPAGLALDLPLLRWLRQHFKALTRAVAAAGAITTTVPGILWRDVTVPFGRTIAQLKRRIRRLEKVTAAGVAVGAVAFALQRMGLNWIRCNSVKRIGKGLCSSPAWLINLLAAGVVEAFVLGDLCRFTLLLEAEAMKFRPVLLELVDVEDALINCGDNAKPGRLSLPPLSLPPMPAQSAFAV